MAICEHVLERIGERHGHWLTIDRKRARRDRRGRAHGRECDARHLAGRRESARNIGGSAQSRSRGDLLDGDGVAPGRSSRDGTRSPGGVRDVGRYGAGGKNLVSPHGLHRILQVREVGL